MKCMTIVGTRPEFVQLAPLSKAMRKNHTELLVNTGQHYDDSMSQIFFREMNLPTPAINLGVGSGSHAQQTGEIMIRLEDVMLQEEPDYAIVYGDTNSTVAGALVAAKLNVPIAHIEAGLRSFDRKMPEEINRILTDHISNLLFAPTQIAVDNLKAEGIIEGVHKVGDVRIDVLQNMVGRVSGRAESILEQVGLNTDETFALATIHRASNTDYPERLGAIVESFTILQLPIILPVHPRLRKMMAQYELSFGKNVHLIDPIGFLDMVALLDRCQIVITDSGGVQKEAYMLHRPIITLRDTTEWVETIEVGWNRLCEPDPDQFQAIVDDVLNHTPLEHPDLYGEFGVSDRILDILVQHL